MGYWIHNTGFICHSCEEVNQIDPVDITECGPWIFSVCYKCLAANTIRRGNGLPLRPMEQDVFNALKNNVDPYSEDAPFYLADSEIVPSYPPGKNFNPRRLAHDVKATEHVIDSGSIPSHPRSKNRFREATYAIGINRYFGIDGWIQVLWYSAHKVPKDLSVPEFISEDLLEI